MKYLSLVVHRALHSDHTAVRHSELWGTDTARCSCGKKWDFTSFVFKENWT